MSSTILISDLSFAWPDGEPVFDGLDLAVGTGRTALIGANGSGKSTLLRLVTGALTPTRGTVRVHGTLGYLPQDLTLDADRPVDDVLGIARDPSGAGRRRARRHRSTVHFAAIGDDWGVDDRARETLDRLGLGHVDLDRPVGALSGGEAVLLGLAGATAAAAARTPARRTDQQPRPRRAGTAVRHRDRVARRAAPGQPRPRAARPGRPGGRAARRRGAAVRRHVQRVRARARRRAGGRAACASGPPRATCAGRSGNWPTRTSSSPGGSATGRRCGTPSASRRR